MAKRRPSRLPNNPKVRAGFALLASIVFAGALVASLLGVALPSPAPPNLPPTAPLGPPLTQHVALIIIDGLRYDLATDRAVMPEMARRMAMHAHGEIWANKISMTSSAVLTYGTGQRGELDQIANNESGHAVPYANLPANTRAAGRVTAATGDRAWFQLYPGAWTLEHPDPFAGIDIDYNSEIFDAAHAFLRHVPAPAFYVAHFVTPDHQAHSYGTEHPRYRAHLLAFDKTVADLLDAMPTDWTVFVTSDHGARVDGHHGSDSPEQRRSPIYAYGPGIVQDRNETRTLDQIDLATTFAALLGIAPPAVSRGHLLAEWLDVPAAEQARLACADLARLSTYAGHVLEASTLDRSGAGQACAQGTATGKIAAARTAAQALDRAFDAASVTGSALGWLVVLFAIAGSIAIAWIVLDLSRAQLASYAALALLLMALGTALAFEIERLSGNWSAVVLAVAAFLLYAALGLALWRAGDSAAWVDRNPAIGALLIPGILLATATWQTQANAFAAAGLTMTLSMVHGLPRAGAPFSLAQAPRARWSKIGWTFVLFLCLIRIAFERYSYLPPFIEGRPDLVLGLALGSIALFAAIRHARKTSLMPTVVGAILAMSCLWLRRSAPAPFCLTAWLSLGALAFLTWRRGDRRLTELLALSSYAWVSRDAEIPALLATYLVACFAGDSFARDLARDVRDDGPNAPLRPTHLLALITFLFAWTYSQRIGVQLGIDFTSFDFGAGSFREADASLLRILAAVLYKHVLARAAILFAVLIPLRADYRNWSLRGLMVAEAARIAVLTVHLIVCRGSFWTSLHALGDLPHAMLGLVTAAFAYQLSTRSPGTR